jgi:hypothetical protein
MEMFRESFITPLPTSPPRRTQGSQRAELLENGPQIENKSRRTIAAYEGAEQLWSVSREGCFMLFLQQVFFWHERTEIPT